VVIAPVVCRCVFHKGGKPFDAHALTWASIRAVHATLFLSFVTHTHIHTYIRTHTCARARARAASTYTPTYICTRVFVHVGTRKHFAFVMLVGRDARFDD